MLRETKENVQGTNSEAKETGTQINSVDQKEEGNIQPEQNEETRIQKNEESLRCSPGRGNTGHCAVMLYVGEGPRGSNDICSTLCQISVTPSATHNQTGPLWCWFPSGWACACSRLLWPSPTNSPVRLGVSPAATPTPIDVFNKWFEALFPCAGTLGCEVCCPVHQLLPCPPAAALPSPFHNPPPAGSTSHCLASSPLCPSCPSPSLLLIWMNVSSLSPWLLDFHTVQFSVSSGCFLFLNCCCPSFGCARRHSVSTYASFLTGNPDIFFLTRFFFFFLTRCFIGEYVLPFSRFCWWFPLLCKNFLVWCGPICLFFLFPFPEDIMSEKILLRNIQDFAVYVFFVVNLLCA